MADLTQTNWSETDASNNQPAPDGAPEGMPPGGLNDAIRAIMGAVKRWFSWSTPKTTGGTGTAYTVSYTVAPGALVDGMTHLVQFHAVNGAPATLNVNSLGAKPLHYYEGGVWKPIIAGVLTIGMICRVAYNQADGAYRLTSLPIGITAVTQAAGNNSTAIATTAFVATALGTAGFQTGDVKIAYRTTEPAGWLFMNGKTIGNAASGATARANADAEALFTHCWNEEPTNTILVIQTSSGAPTTRGASAAADFAANKRMPLPDPEGCAFAVADNMGGGPTARLGFGANGGFSGAATLGRVGGEKNHQLTVVEMPSHTHVPILSPNGLGSSGDPAASGGGGPIVGNATTSAGGDVAHNNVQPTFVINAFIKL